MNKNLRTALIEACIRLLNHMSKFIAPQPDEKSHQMMLGNIADIAGTLNALNKNLAFIAIHPDVLAEALAYECKKQQPDPEVIIDLTLMLQR
jgi:hypothetical protein